MSHWEYRIVKYKDGSGYGLHEVYYDNDDQPWAMTTHPVTFTADDPDDPDNPDDPDDPAGVAEIRQAINWACEDANNRKTLVEPEKWPGKAP